ncbi:MAG: FMN-binding protein [Bacilli bacterium]|nr:FMN-binding protein [Bacilli bacterium]
MVKQKAIKYGIFLCVLGIIVGVLLSVVNAITKPVIDNYEKEKVNNLLLDYNDTYDWNDSDITDSIENLHPQILNVYAGKLNGEEVVRVYKVQTTGYSSGAIVSMIYIENNKIMKVSIVSTTSQTKGVGSKVEDLSYLKIYEGKSCSEYNNDVAQNHNNKSVDVISGATVSSRGVISAVIIACTEHLSGE